MLKINDAFSKRSVEQFFTQNINRNRLKIIFKKQSHSIVMNYVFNHKIMYSLLNIDPTTTNSLSESLFLSSDQYSIHAMHLKLNGTSHLYKLNTSASFDHLKTKN